MPLDRRLVTKPTMPGEHTLRHSYRNMGFIELSFSIYNRVFAPSGRLCLGRWTMLCTPFGAPAVYDTRTALNSSDIVLTSPALLLELCRHAHLVSLRAVRMAFALDRRIASRRSLTFAKRGCFLFLGMLYCIGQIALSFAYSMLSAPHAMLRIRLMPLDQWHRLYCYWL